MPRLLAICVGLFFSVSLAAGAGVVRSPLQQTRTSLDAASSLLRPTASGKIQHVVLILQENRSFDNLFQGFPGADTSPYGYMSNGKKIALTPVPLEAQYDLDHSAAAFITDCNGTGSIPGTDCRMNGFNNEYVGCYSSCPPHPQYAYVPHDETKPYFDIAKQYVLGDRMFTSHIDQSFVSHQYIIAGQANNAVDLPWGVWGCGGGRQDVVGTLLPGRQSGPNIKTCFDDQTLGDEVDAAGLTWRFYASALGTDGDLWSAFRAIKHIRYGPDWHRNVVSPQTKFFHDVKKGFLANVTWITPTCYTSDHSGCGGNLGPDWVASIVNAVGKSQFWQSTAIFVYWDEWGGWSDHVPPPYVDNDGLGMRVPLLVVSPYAKQGHVSHVQYEHGSLVRFVEDQFGLHRLAASDARAKSPAGDCFDFNQVPRVFQRIPTRHSETFFESMPPEPPKSERYLD